MDPLSELTLDQLKNKHPKFKGTKHHYEVKEALETGKTKELSQWFINKVVKVGKQDIDSISSRIGDYLDDMADIDVNNQGPEFRDFKKKLNEWTKIINRYDFSILAGQDKVFVPPSGSASITPSPSASVTPSPSASVSATQTATIDPKTKQPQTTEEKRQYLFDRLKERNLNTKDYKRYFNQIEKYNSSQVDKKYSKTLQDESISLEYVPWLENYFKENPTERPDKALNEMSPRTLINLYNQKQYEELSLLRDQLDEIEGTSIGGPRSKGSKSYKKMIEENERAIKSYIKRVGKRPDPAERQMILSEIYNKLQDEPIDYNTTAITKQLLSSQLEAVQTLAKGQKIEGYGAKFQALENALTNPQLTEQELIGALEDANKLHKEVFEGKPAPTGAEEEEEQEEEQEPTDPSRALVIDPRDPTAPTGAGRAPPTKKYTLKKISADRSVKVSEDREAAGERQDDYDGLIQFAAREENMEYVNENQILFTQQDIENNEDFLDLYVAKCDPENCKIARENYKQERAFLSGGYKEGSLEPWFAMPNPNVLNDNKYTTDPEGKENLYYYEPKVKNDFVLNPVIPREQETELKATRSEQNNQALYNVDVKLNEPYPQTFNSEVQWEDSNKNLFNYGKF
jgi:hypothetical protein